MNPLKPKKNRFFFAALIVFALLAIATERQALIGKVPLPADILRYFSPWDASHIGPVRHAEMSDSLTLFYPWRYFQQTSLHHWTLPLWNPSILGGEPFLAETQSALFYPPHLLYLIFSTPTAWTIGVLLNVMLAGVFTAWFVRDIGASRTGAIAAGVIFSCCGFVTAWQLFSPLADAAIWLPFIFFAVERLRRSPSPSMLVLAAVGFALTVLAGHPETSMHVAAAGAAYALWHCVSSRREAGMRFAWFTAAGVLALALAAIQVMPTLEWIRHVNLPEDIRWPARPISEMLAFFSRDISTNLNSARLPVPESSSYVAPLALLLAPFAFFYRKRRDAFFFLLVLVVCVQLIWKIGPVDWVVEHVGTLARLKNWRTLLLMDFSLAVLAGLGITVLTDSVDVRASLRRYVWVLPVLCTIGIAIGIQMNAAATHVPVEWSRRTETSAVLLGLSFLLIAIRLWNKIGAGKFAALALMLLLLDMGTFRSGSLPYVRRADIFPDVPLFTFLKAQSPSIFRIGIVDGALAGNFSMMYGVEEVGGYDVSLKLVEKFMGDFTSPGSTSVTLSADKVVKVHDRRLDLLNVRYLVATTANSGASLLASVPNRFSLAFSDGRIRVFENKHVLDRVRFLPMRRGAIEVIPDVDKQLDRLRDPSFDIENSVVLSEMPKGMDGVVSAEGTHVSWISNNPNESVFHVTDTQPGLIEVNQTYYPGWRAYVDDREVPVLRANYALTAIPVVAGGHIVRLVFDPTSFRIGWMITIAGCLVSIGLVAFSMRQSNRRARSEA